MAPGNPRRDLNEIPPGSLRAFKEFFDNHTRHTHRFYDQISRFLEYLQSVGCKPGTSIERLESGRIAMEGVVRGENEEEPYVFTTLKKPSLAFELWWGESNADADKSGGKAISDNDRTQESWTADPPSTAIRVFVQLQTFQDHATVSFYIDAAKPFGMGQINTASEVAKDFSRTRRNRILTHVELVRKSSLEQIRSGSVDTPAAEQPPGLSVHEAQLSDAAEYLYHTIWEEFSERFAFQATEWADPDKPDPLDTDACAIFSSQRGIMMSIRGLEKEKRLDKSDRDSIRKSLLRSNAVGSGFKSHIQRENWEPRYSGATATIGPVELFDKSIGEPETILKSVWPFIRRAYPDANARNWVGCGILGWRALLVTDFSSLASESKGDQQGAKLSHQRFLIMHLGEPHREQIGRFVERYVALETMRLYALRYKETIRNAYISLRNINRELDLVWSTWTKRRHDIEIEYKDVKAAWQRRSEGRKNGSAVLTEKELEKERDYFQELRVLSSTIEANLIGIAARMDRMGPSGAGQLAYKINQAENYINEYCRMTPTLEIGNVDGWMNYQQFADRNMLPAFDMIRRTGERLADTQEQLRSLTRVVQTGVEIVHLHATQRNTDQLGKIGTHFFWIKYGTAGLLVSWLYSMASNAGYGLSSALDWVRKILEMLM